MSLTTTDLSLKGFASIDATTTKHASFVIRALLAHIIDLTCCDCIVDVFTKTVTEVYQDICREVINIQERARMVNAVLTFFNNSPEVAERFAGWKEEWEAITEMVEGQERDALIGARSLTVATGLAFVLAVDNAATWPRLMKLGLSANYLKGAVREAAEVVDELFPGEPSKAHQVVWQERLDFVELF